MSPPLPGANESPPSLSVRITVNGILTRCPAQLSVEALLGHLNLPEDRVAVERNREIVSRGLRDQIRVRDGDILEIVTFVGGG